MVTRTEGIQSQNFSMRKTRWINTTLILLLAVFLTFTQRSCKAFELRGNYFNFMKVAGNKVGDPASEIGVYTFENADRTVIECGVHCSADPKCQTFCVSVVSNTCFLLSRAVYDMSASLVTDPAWDTWWMLVPEGVTYNNWTLVFRGTAGTNSPMFDVYMGSNTNYEPGCLRLDNVMPCHSHFRSPILNDWTNINQVRVSLYKDGIEEQYMVFDGVGSSITSWFSQDKMIESSWTSLYNATIEQFDAIGFYTPVLPDVRRFYINAQHALCENDIGYLAVLDTSIDICQWCKDYAVTPYPWILYSKEDNYTKWHHRDFSSVGKYFSKLEGYKMNTSASEIYTLVNTEPTVSKCAAHCSVDPNCKSFSVSNESHTCIFMSKWVWDMSISWLLDPAWTTWTIVPESAIHNNWTLVFRGTAGIESPIYEAFMDPSHRGNFEPGCLRLDNALPCHSHFRSPVLNEWKKIDLIRVSLYKGGIEQRYIVFTVPGSLITTWFHKGGIKETTWTSLQYTTFQHFSIAGYTTAVIKDIRRFYINVNHGGCENDIGFLAILDTPIDECFWVNGSANLYTQPTYPWILYSSSDIYTKWSTHTYGLADIFAISVKFLT